MCIEATEQSQGWGQAGIFEVASCGPTGPHELFAGTERMPTISQVVSSHKLGACPGAGLLGDQVLTGRAHSLQFALLLSMLQLSALLLAKVDLDTFIVRTCIPCSLSRTNVSTLPVCKAFHECVCTTDCTVVWPCMRAMS